MSCLLYTITHRIHLMNANAKSKKIAQVPDKSDLTCNHSIRTLICYFTAVLFNYNLLILYLLFVFSTKLYISYTLTLMTIKAKLLKRFYNLIA